MSHFEIYQSNGEWRWRLVASNGETVCSGEGYTREEDCREGIDAVARAVLSQLVLMVEEVDE